MSGGHQLGTVYKYIYLIVTHKDKGLCIPNNSTYQLELLNIGNTT